MNYDMIYLIIDRELLQDITLEAKRQHITNTRLISTVLGRWNENRKINALYTKEVFKCQEKQS